MVYATPHTISSWGNTSWGDKRQNFTERFYATAYILRETVPILDAYEGDYEIFNISSLKMDRVDLPTRPGSCPSVNIYVRRLCIDCFAPPESLDDR